MFTRNSIISAQEWPKIELQILQCATNVQMTSIPLVVFKVLRENLKRLKIDIHFIGDLRSVDDTRVGKMVHQ